MTYDLGGIYLIWLSDTHYYGGRSKRIHNRCANHRAALRKGTHGNRHCQNVWNANGVFRYEVLHRAASLEEQMLLEQAWLDENVGKPGCLNKSRKSEGNSGNPHSPEGKKNISDSLKGRVLSEEHKRKLSESRKGMVFSPEHRKNIGAANLKRTPESRSKCVEAMRRARLGVRLTEEQLEARRLRRHSEDTKRKISEARRGMIFSEEHRKKLSEAAKARCARTKLKDPEPVGS